MRFGVGDFSAQRPPGSSADHRQLYAELMEQAQLIEAVGLDSAWISEHHFAEDGYMAAVLPIAAAALTVTERITVGTDRLAASLYDPVRLAEDAIALDLLSGGRFVLGLSLCYREIEFRGLGMDPAADLDRLESLVPQLRAAFSGWPLVASGRLRVTVTPLPHSPVGPRLMIAADDPDGGRRSGRLADVLMIDPTEPWAAMENAVKAFDAESGGSEREVAVFVYGGISRAGREAAWSEIAEGFRYASQLRPLAGEGPHRAVAAGSLPPPPRNTGGGGERGSEVPKPVR